MKAENNNRNIRWLLAYALVIMGAATAWGIQLQQVNDLERRVEQQEVVAENINSLNIAVARIEERLGGFQETQRDQGYTLKNIERMLRGPG